MGPTTVRAGRGDFLALKGAVVRAEVIIRIKFESFNQYIYFYNFSGVKQFVL